MTQTLTITQHKRMSDVQKQLKWKKDFEITYEKRLYENPMLKTEKLETNHQTQRLTVPN